MPRKKKPQKEPKSKRKSTTQWFVEPIGADPAHSNKVVNDYLGTASVRVMEQMAAVKGHPRDVWQCERWEAKKLMASGQTTRAYFALWSRPNNYGPIRYVGFLDRKKKEKEMKRTFKMGPRPLTETSVIEPPF